MKSTFFFSAILTLLACRVLPAQHEHSDIEFGYDNLASPSAFLIEQDNVTLEGFQFFESAMEELDPFAPGDFSSDEPGFATNDAEGLLVNPGDRIWLTTLDASIHSTYGLGYVNYYDPVTDSLSASGQLRIEDNSGATPDLILDGSTVVSGDLQQFIGLADGDGDIHDHLIIDLLNDASAPLGAYGIMVQLESDFATADGNIDLSSDQFWVIFNHGMTDTEFDTLALPRFGVAAVPEPGSLLLISSVAVLAGLRRRRC